MGYEKAKKQRQKDEEDEEDEYGDVDEETCRKAYTEVLGACMKCSPEAFMKSGAPVFAPLMQQWLLTKQHKVLALFLFCDMVEHLQEHSQPFWDWGMQAVLSNLHDKDAGVRQACAYCVNL